MNDLLCNSCCHKEVCSLKGIFQEAQNAVSRMEVVYNDQDKSTRTTRLSTLNWIEPVKLQCKHYSSNITYRVTGPNVINEVKV